MGRTWMTGLAIAGVIGSGGAAIAGVVRSDVIGAADAGGTTTFSPPPATDPSTPSTLVTPGSPQITTYDVGGAGWVDVALGAEAITVDHVVAAQGWNLLEITGDVRSVQVRFANATTVVTFGASLAAEQVETTVTEEAIPGATTTVPATEAPAPAAAPATAPRPASTSRPAGTSAPAAPATSATSAPASTAPASTAPRSSSTSSPATATTAAPTTAAPTTAAPTTATPTTAAPPTTHTSAPSGTSGGGDDDGGDDGEHDDD